MAGKKRNEKECAAIAGRPIDFLGYCFTRENVRLRKSIKQRFARRMKTIRNPERRRQVLASYYGWCKWGKCAHLWNVITDDSDMSFAEKGISESMMTKDGKRFFKNREVKAMDILNRPIVVVDFEKDIKTKHGGGRYAVLLHLANESETLKMVTNSYSIKSVLDQAREHDEKHPDEPPILPCETVLKRRDIGSGKYDYYFE